MSFGAAISSCLNQYAGFSGRARRSEYWFFVLFAFLAYLIAAVLGVAAPSVGRLLMLVVMLGLFLPGLAVSVRRLHDTGRPGWWLLINLVPFGGIVTLVFTCLDSEPHPNRYGPSPKPGVAGFSGYGQPYPPVGYGQQPYPQNGSYYQQPPNGN